jgi:hypothetical protein
MSKTDSARTPRTLIAAILNARLQVPTLDALVEESPERWCNLVDAMLSADLERARDAQLGKDQGLDIEARVNAALPPDLREASFRYHEGIEAERQVEIQAAYELGVAVGRRFGGAR